MRGPATSDWAGSSFAQERAFILRRFLREKSWQETERVVIGGGMREHRIGELAIGRASLLGTSGGK